MNPSILINSVLVSSILAVLPVLIMLWKLKKLKQRTYAWAVFGYYSSLLFAGIMGYTFMFFYNSPLPAYHIILFFQSYFTFSLFKNELINPRLKKVTYFFLAVILISETSEFFMRGGFFTNNIITYSIINLAFILQYFLFLVDSITNKPNVIYDRKGPFYLLSAILFYSINQLFFSLIEEDIRMLLVDNQYAIFIWTLFVWFYMVFLLFSSYFLWKNLRS